VLQPDVAEVVPTRRAWGDVDELPGAGVTRIVDAYERLGARVLGRMRDLRQDLDADLSEVRSELSSLRTEVEDVADRVQLRQMRSSIDELRSDVSSLRRAVLEWPELERMAADLAALHTANADLLELARQPRAANGGDGPDVAAEAIEALRADIVGLRDAISALHDEVAALGDSVVDASPAAPSAGSDELDRGLAELREEIVSLRRRISLRASGSAITPEHLEEIADAVAKRLKQSLRQR
jgi:hypothetical protein